MRLAALWRRLRQDGSGNVLMVTCGGITMLVFAIGFGIDYARSEMMQTKLNAAADAAVLVAVDPAEIGQSDATAQADAQQMFDGQAALLAGNGVTVISRTVTAVTTSQSTSSGVTQMVRNATVTYRATVKTMFSAILGAATLTIAGSTASNAAQPPNINFYVMMDASPSMLLPSTSSGLANLYGKTGCAFACHEKYPRNDGIVVKDGNGRSVFLNTNYYGTGTGSGVWYTVDPVLGGVYNSSGTQIGVMNLSIYPLVAGLNSLIYIPTTGLPLPVSIPVYYADGYWLAHNYNTLYPGQGNIEMRVTDETAAAQDLIPYAQSQAAQLHVTYQMQFNAFNWTHSGSTTPIVASTTMTNVNSLTASNVPDVDGTQDYWYVNSYPSFAYFTNDQGTEFYNTLSKLNAAMPNPGTGAATSTPQETVLIITDGMSDELLGGSRTHSPLTSTILSQCTAIKNRGIRIAILYTQYIPATISYDSWSQSNVLPYLTPTDQVLAALQSCASSNSLGTPLLYQVSTGDSISAALQKLFAMTLQTARLTQ
jgi:Flp pilus assembly protein TadG